MSEVKQKSQSKEELDWQIGVKRKQGYGASCEEAAGDWESKCEGLQEDEQQEMRNLHDHVTGVTVSS